MAIVRTQSGHVFDVPDEELAKYAKKPEEVSNDVSGRSDESGPGGPGGPGGHSGGSSPIQIIVNYIQGGGGGGGAMKGPPGKGEAGGKVDDVAGKYCGWHNCWRNCWHNCWRNYGHY